MSKPSMHLARKTLTSAGALWERRQQLHHTKDGDEWLHLHTASTVSVVHDNSDQIIWRCKTRKHCSQLNWQTRNCKTRSDFTLLMKCVIHTGKFGEIPTIHVYHHISPIELRTLKHNAALKDLRSRSSWWWHHKISVKGCWISRYFITDSPCLLQLTTEKGEAPKAKSFHGSERYWMYAVN